jgi:hypothetical protein
MAGVVVNVPYGHQMNVDRQDLCNRNLLRAPLAPGLRISNGLWLVSVCCSMSFTSCSSTKRLVLIAVNLVHLSPVVAAISTSASVPPLQWLNITRLLSGPAAPPLKGSSIGYDEATRTLLIFGGESEGGFPQSKTYL